MLTVMSSNPVMSALLFPFRSSFYYWSVRFGSGLVATADGVLSTLRLALVVAGVQMFDKEHYFINMDLFQSRIRYTVLFAVNIIACTMLGVGIILSESRPWPILMVPWLVMFLCSTWLYYPNIIYHGKGSVWPVVICVFIMVVCLYCWCVVLSYFLEVLNEATSRRLRSDKSTTGGGVTT